MRNIEILKGEVKEFIDLNFYSLTVEYYDMIRDLYSQPFKPEMITEYFDGWKVSDIGIYYYGNEAKFSYQDEFLNGYTIRFEDVFIYIHKHPLIKYDTLTQNKPNTLSQFITNCIQAGIKLTWKEMNNEK